MWDYYRKNSPKLIHVNTQVSVIRQAHRRLHVVQNGTTLENTKPLGVALDRSVTYKYHRDKTRQEVSVRNNILKKLANNKWWAKTAVLIITVRRSVTLLLNISVRSGPGHPD